MYKSLPNLVLGFHGCDIETYNTVLHENKNLTLSNNAHDWLGNGIYFWENSYDRALEWSQSHCKTKPAVIGAIIELGYCLNLSDFGSTEILRIGYDLLKLECENTSTQLPINRDTKNNTDLLIRELDCAVIQRIHNFNRESKFESYDSIRGIFIEGKQVYENSGFMEKTHVQLCVANPNCIKGYFSPRFSDNQYSRV